MQAYKYKIMSKQKVSAQESCNNHIHENKNNNAQNKSIYKRRVHV